MYDAKELASLIVDAVFGTQQLEVDTPQPNTGLTVEMGGVATPVERGVWSAWTGRRYVWGVEYHGPVHAIGAPEGVTYTGARVCRCTECQRHVAPADRPN